MQKFRHAVWLVLWGLLVAAGAQAESPGKLKLLGGPRGAEVHLNGAHVGRLPIRHATPISGAVLLELFVNDERVHLEELEVAPRSRVRHQIPEVLSEAQPQAPALATTPAPEIAAPGAASASALSTTAANFPSTPAPEAAAPEDGSGPVLVLRQLPKVVAASPVQAGGAAPKANKSALGDMQADQLAADLLPANVAARAAQDLNPTSAPKEPATRRVPKAALARTDEEEDDDDMLDMFIFETFAGPSFMAMALGQNSDVIANLAALPESAAGDLDLSQLQLTDMVRSVSETGSTVGGAASIRLAFISLGGRMSYSSYSSLDIMTVTGELAFRAYADPVEFYLGFGMGGGFISDSSVYVKQTDGLALRAGLGLNFRFTKHTSFGVGADAVGWFLAGKGISPAQLGHIDQNSDHPIGGSVPIQANFSVLL